MSHEPCCSDPDASNDDQTTSCSGDAGHCCCSESDASQRELTQNEHLIIRYLRGVENFDPRVFDLTDEQLDITFNPERKLGRWSVRTLLGHLADTELVMTFRIRRALAEDNPVLSLWDESSFVDGGLYSPELHPPIAGFVAAIHTLRRWTAELLMTLSDEQWERLVMHPERGELTLRDLVELTTTHLEHHNDFLQRKINTFLGEPEPISGGCCGGHGTGKDTGCGCQSQQHP